MINVKFLSATYVINLLLLAMNVKSHIIYKMKQLAINAQVTLQIVINVKKPMEKLIVISV